MDINNFEENRRYSLEFYTRMLRCVEQDFYQTSAHDTANDEFYLERHTSYLTHICKLLTLKETP